MNYQVIIEKSAVKALDDIKDLAAAANFLDEDNGISWKESKIEFLEDFCAALETERKGEFVTLESAMAILEL